MSRTCYITGTGLVSAQGVGVDANWRALLGGAVLHETGRVPVIRDPTVSRVSQLAILAAGEAVNAAGKPRLADDRTALVVGTSKGPIEDWIDQLNGNRPASINTGLAQVAADLAAETGHANGPRLTSAGACASGLHALIRARDLIRQGQCDAALVVAAESATHPLFEANFRRLGVLANPAEGCRPFDARRKGFLLAEAAAAVWLTDRPTPGCVVLDNGHVFSDATHIAAPDSSGVSLRHLLGRLATTDVDMVHAHGTGTVLNDAAEYAAIASALRSSTRPHVCSHKHAIGHTQGAAGLISVVMAIESHRTGCIPGNTNTVDVDQLMKLGPLVSSEVVVRPVKTSVVTAAGFGGALAGVRLKTSAA